MRWRRRRPLRAQPRLLHAPQGRRRHDVGRGRAERSGASSRTSSSRSFGPAARPGAELTSHHNDVAASLQAVLEEVYLHVVDRLQKRTGQRRPLPRGRRGAERRRERAHPRRDGVRGALRPGRSGRLRHRRRRRVLRLEPGARRAARLRDGARVHRARVRRRRDRRARSSRRVSSAERLDDDALLPLLAERIAAGDVVGWFQGRMEFGPRALGNRSIVADPRRARHEGQPQRAHQAPRAVPPVRAVGPRGGDGRVVRPGLPVAVHDARLQDARRRSAS